jgi:beta-N-acetylhexosaminidase
MSKKSCLAAACAALVVLPVLLSGQSSSFQRFDRELTKKDSKWVRKTLEKMTLDEKIGQMFMADANAIFMNRGSDLYTQLEHHVRDNKVGGIILFRSDVWATAILTNRMQALSKVPLLVSADLEMGLGMRLNDTPWWPPNMAVGATGDPTLARRQGEYTAREARAAGINWLYAPVADVNNNPDNPVINTRSYGENPEDVSRFVAAFVDGAQAAGAMATAKHFPGHGDTATDSHIGLPVIDVDRARLDALELVPFRAAIAHHVGSIMSAHIALPRIDPSPVAPLRALSTGEREAAEFVSRTEDAGRQPAVPGTLSHVVLTGLLRQHLGFNGLVVSDAMNMAGIAARYDAASSSVAAIKAGMDVIEKCPDIDAGIAGVKAAVKRGEISEARLDESVRRILEAKVRLGLQDHRTVAIDQVDRFVTPADSNAVAQEIAERSMTLVRDERKALPMVLTTSSRVLHVSFGDDDGTFTTQVFVGELRGRGIPIEHVSLDGRASAEEMDRFAARLDAGRFDAVIFSSLVRARSGKGSVALPPAGIRAVAEMTKRGLPVVAVSFGNPYVLAALPDVKTYLAAFSPYPVSQRAAARALLGEIAVGGKLPVSIPGVAPRGTGVVVPKAPAREP